MPAIEKIPPTYIVGVPPFLLKLFFPASDPNAVITSTVHSSTILTFPNQNPQLIESTQKFPDIANQHWIPSSTGVNPTFLMAAEYSISEPLWLLAAGGQAGFKLQGPLSGSIYTLTAQLQIGYIDQQQGSALRVQSLYDSTVLTITGITINASNGMPAFLIQFPKVLIEKLLVKSTKLVAVLSITMTQTAGAVGTTFYVNRGQDVVTAVGASVFAYNSIPLAGINLELLPAKAFADITLGGSQVS